MRSLKWRGVNLCLPSLALCCVRARNSSRCGENCKGGERKKNKKPVGVSPAEVLCEHKTSVNKGGVHSFNLNTVQIKKASQPQRHDKSSKDGGSTVGSNYTSLQGNK